MQQLPETESTKKAPQATVLSLAYLYSDNAMKIIVGIGAIFLCLSLEFINKFFIDGTIKLIGTVWTISILGAIAPSALVEAAKRFPKSWFGSPE